MSKSPRLVAIEILVKWSQTGVSIDLLVMNSPKFQDQRDTNLLKAILFGVLQKYALMEWVVERFSKQPLKKIKKNVLHALYVGIYQVLFMDRVPASAAVNETVKAVKKLKQPRWICGFVNSILRNVERQKNQLLVEIELNNITNQARLNHPAWLIHRWKKRYGEAQMEAICTANNCRSALCLRVNTCKISVEKYANLLRNKDIGYSPGKYCLEAIWLNGEIGMIEELPGYGEGYFWVQDEIAQLLSYLLGPFNIKKTYLDCCAGLGGKTAAIVQLAAQESRIIAVEPNEMRIKLLGENMNRLDVNGVSVFHGTLQEFLHKTDEDFQAVFVDAPCSGLGVTGRHPDIRWVRAEEDLQSYQQKQLAILGTAARLVSPGGILVYATCSTEPEENDQVIEKFLAKNPLFSIQDGRLSLSKKAHSLVDANGFIKTLPGDQLSDGFFACRLVRKSD